MHFGEDICLLVDNGSVRDHAALFTRKLAEKIQQASSEKVLAVSLDHSFRIPVEKLNGIPVPILNALLSELAEQSSLKTLTILPLLMVGGGAIYQKLQAQVDVFRSRRPDVTVKMAKALIDPNETSAFSIPALMVKNIEATLAQTAEVRPDVIVVDHGSPVQVASEMRNWVAQEVEKRLDPGTFGCVMAASMERRPGENYDFNEPLLQTALQQCADRGVDMVVISKLFLQPGKHSGKKGDIDGIVQNFQKTNQQLDIRVVRKGFLLNDLTKLFLSRLRTLRTHESEF